MSKYSFQAINESGNAVSGVIEADSLEAATNLLSERGFIPSKVLQETEGLQGGVNWLTIKERLTRVKTTDLILFTKQFRTLVRAGIPIISIFQVLENQTENIKFKKIVGTMTLSIKEGSTLYDAFRKHPETFSPLYCSMIRAGETSGALPDVMERLIYIIEHENKIKSDIKSALQYPITVAVFLGIAFLVLLTFAVPRFAQIFLRAGVELPLPTRVCIWSYQFLINYWYLIIGAIIVGIGVLTYYLRTEQGRYVKDTFVLKVPIFGPLFVKAAMSRFASIFAILYESGIYVLNSIVILSTTIGNTAISREFDRIKESVEEGGGISKPLRSARYFTPMVINMVAMGEVSGKLDEMLRQIAIHYDDEVEYAVKRLSEAIGPVLTIGLAAMVGFFALAIFLPMWDLTKLVMKAKM